MNEHTQKLTEYGYKFYQSMGCIIIILICALIAYLVDDGFVRLITVSLGLGLYFYCLLLWVGAMNWKVRRDVKIFNEKVDEYRREHGLDEYD